jgi:CpeT protein
MKARNIIFAFNLTLLAALVSCGPKIVSDPEVMPPFSELAVRCQKWMIGSFENEAQVKSNSDCQEMKLHQCAIWTSEKNALWLYSEQIEKESGHLPTRQVIFKITDGMNGGLLLQTYALPGNAFRFAGSWRDPDTFNTLSPFELSLLGSCGLHLKKTLKGSISGGTSGEDCSSTRAGASYQTEEITLGSMEIRSWRRGFNAAGQQVWGSSEGPIVFDRRNAAARPESVKPGSNHIPDLGPYDVKDS